MVNASAESGYENSDAALCFRSASVDESLIPLIVFVSTILDIHKLNDAMEPPPPPPPALLLTATGSEGVGWPFAAGGGSGGTDLISGAGAALTELTEQTELIG